jgi:hypothetical protein
MSKILKLTSENILRLSAVEITPDGNLIVIGGKNGAGKSSAISSIEMLLGGKDAIPGVPVHKGAKKGEIVAEIGDVPGAPDLIVKRTIQPNGNSALTVSARDGAKYPSPQALLDKLVGSLSFDPLAFARMKPAEQAETFRRVTGLDFSELNAARQALYDERRSVGQEVTRLTGALDTAPAYPSVTAPVDVSALAEELASVGAHNAARAQEAQTLENLRAGVADAKEKKAKAEEMILRLEAQIEEQRLVAQTWAEEVHKIVARGKELAAIHAAGADKDAATLTAQLAKAQTTNERHAANVRRAALAEEHAVAAARYAGLEEQLANLDQQRQEMTAAAVASLPVTGLSLDDGTVCYGGLPFDQASSAEQLRVSVAMGLALNPALRVLLIRDGSLLDEDGLRLVAEMAEKADASVWMERVGEGKECSVVIEDGMVKEDRTKTATGAEK